MSGPSEARPGGGNMVPPCQCGNQRVGFRDCNHSNVIYRCAGRGPQCNGVYVITKMDEEDLLGLLGRSIQQACRDRVALSEIRNAVASSADAQGSGQPGFLPQHSPISPVQLGNQGLPLQPAGVSLCDYHAACTDHERLGLLLEMKRSLQSLNEDIWELTQCLLLNLEQARLRLREIDEEIAAINGRHS
ncbi:uncharacterized protein EI90DRAFT_3117335 [Cantharellus anzutake]|uniref:uncharacterized protein n=1 Tax=Cantharellus anzutake TaxID=1750568 RepID=UPI0019041F37|nr:uncharacterized protein EI90DRAFT_3117335 [Cantharellus anzutake]KAF8339511.1 hypothetical protein EI90DRAFT_3117335 [Cantharellus anzutake]